MRRMLVHQRQSRVAKEKLGHDQQSDVFFAVKRLLEDVTPVTVGSKFNHPASVSLPWYVRHNETRWSYEPHATHDLASLFGSRSGL